MCRPAGTTSWRRTFVVGALAVSATSRILAEAPSTPPTAGELAETRITMSMAPQIAARRVAFEDKSSERLRAVVMGASPTLVEPAAPIGFAQLNRGRPLRTGSRKTAWMDYMLDSGVPAWSLRHVANERFDVSASDRPAGVAPVALISGPAVSVSGYRGFDLSTSPLSGAANVLAPGAWLAPGASGSHSVQMPSPLTPMGAAPVTVGDAGLPSIPIAAPTSAAGVAAGAASVPMRTGQ